MADAVVHGSSSEGNLAIGIRAVRSDASHAGDIVTPPL